MLQPQDLGLLGYLITSGGTEPTSHGDKAEAIYYCATTEIELLESLERLLTGHLVSKVTGRVFSSNTKDVLRAVPYVYPGAVTENSVLGLPTAWSQSTIADLSHIVSGTPIVWEYAVETEVPARITGISVEPLFKTVPIVATRSPDLYIWLSLLDCLRYGKAREVNFALNGIDVLLREYDRAISQDETDENYENMLCDLIN